jgi:hypothetical protein
MCQPSISLTLLCEIAALEKLDLLQAILIAVEDFLRMLTVATL